MAKIIEFYIPQSFRKVSKWLPPHDAARCWSFKWRYDNPRDSSESHGEDVSCGLKARRNQRACGIAMPWRDRNRALQPVATQGLNEPPFSEQRAG
jgi:hypothetical protein